VGGESGSAGCCKLAELLILVWDLKVKWLAQGKAAEHPADR